MPEPKYEYENFYYHCGQEWSDPECDSMHNDHCPVCDGEIEPYKSVELATGEEIIHADLDELKSRPRDFSRQDVIRTLESARTQLDAILEKYKARTGISVFPLLDQTWSELNELHRSMDEGKAPTS